MLLSLRLRSTRALRRFGGCISLELCLRYISEKDPDDCRMRGKRLFGFGGTLCATCVDGDVVASNPEISGAGWAIHSSERSSSHGWLIVMRRVVLLAEVRSASSSLTRVFIGEDA